MNFQKVLFLQHKVMDRNMFLPAPVDIKLTLLSNTLFINERTLQTVNAVLFKASASFFLYFRTFEMSLLYSPK